MYFIAEIYKIGRDAPLSAALAMAIENFQQLKISNYQKYPHGIGTYINTLYVTDKDTMQKAWDLQAADERQFGHFEKGKWVSDVGNVHRKTYITHELHGRSAEPNYMIIHPDLWNRIMFEQQPIYYDCNIMLYHRGIAITTSTSLVDEDEFMLACRTPKQYGIVENDNLRVLDNAYLKDFYR